MSAARPDNEAIFHAAREIREPDRRDKYVREACEGDEARIALIKALLAAADAPDSLLDHPAIGPPDATLPVASPDGEISLEFLAPSDKPDVLGRLSHYEILEVLGRGGMGIVLRAFDEKLHRVVAIKVMAEQLAANAAARRRFTREAQAQAAVSHDHVVTIHAVEGDCLRPYLVMHYVAGMSLQQRLDRDGPLELHEVLRVGMQTASSLSAAHAQGLVHRDIKPANILLENGVERVKVADFGLARAAGEASMTQTGAVAGTPHYMSPEQAQGEPLDQRTDLFSLGSVLYAMCTGRAPFRASGSMAVLKRVCEETPTPIRETNPQIPDWLAAIIDKLHAKNPADRYQTAAEVADLLSRHLAHVQHPSVAPLPVLLQSASGRRQPSAIQAVKQAVDAAQSEGLRPRLARAGLRRFAATAVVLLVGLVVGLTLTEATGVTNLRATVIRIFTPHGVLVVETDDPAVKVSIEGGGGLVITGAGPQEVRLKPGNYKLQAAKDGKAVRLDHHLVTINRGDKRIVRVSLEMPDTDRNEGAIDDDIRKLTERIENFPADERARIDRAHLYVRQRRWRDGADDLSAAGKATLQQPGDAFLYAILLVHLGELDLHRRLCEQMVERFAATDDVWTANCLLKSCLLRPRAVDPAKLPLDLLSEDREFATNEPQWLLREARAFHAYRSGRLEEARRLVRETLSVPTYKNDPLYAPRALSILAIASYKSGDRQLALDLYQQARQQFDKIQLPPGHPGASSWLFTEIIRREAAQELGLEEATPRGAIQPFVVLAANGIEVRKYDTLAQAVSGASDGDTIEIRGNGPFETDPVQIRDRPLVIRAGAGFRPVLKLSANGNRDDKTMLQSNAALVLEGLTFRGETTPNLRSVNAVKLDGESPLFVANCRFVFVGGSGQVNLIHAGRSTNCEIRQCEFLLGSVANQAVVWSPAKDRRLVVDGCTVAGRGLGIDLGPRGAEPCSVEFTRNTIKGAWSINLARWSNVAAQDQPLSLRVADNVFDCSTFMTISDRPETTPLEPSAALAFVKQLLSYDEQRNVHTAGGRMLWYAGKDWTASSPDRTVNDLEAWKKFWGHEAAFTRTGRVNLQGATALANATLNAGEVTPEDFRLRADSAGYRAGPDGRDLGADVDLVGPGPAYERWKKTPEYQQWLEETGQPRFVPLFNGEDLTGWKSHPDQAGDWTVQDGVLHGSTRQSYLFSERADFENYYLRVEAKINTGGDSSVCFRLPFHLQKWGNKLENYGMSGGYEVDLHKIPSRLLRTGSIFAAHTRVEDPSQILVHVSDDTLINADKWFAMDVLADGNHLVVKINGKTVADCEDPLSRYHAGHIALHVFNSATAVQFRKIEIKELAPGRRETVDPAARELAKWQGEWENADYGRLVIRGERWSSFPKDGFEVASNIKIVEVAEEMTHVLLLSAGVDGKVRTIQTILRVEGNTLHNCGTIGSVRPTEFVNKPGYIYTQWKRNSGPPP
jgi:hypothetical protein